MEPGGLFSGCLSGLLCPAHTPRAHRRTPRNHLLPPRSHPLHPASLIPERALNFCCLPGHRRTIQSYLVSPRSAAQREDSRATAALTYPPGLIGQLGWCPRSQSHRKPSLLFPGLETHAPHVTWVPQGLCTAPSGLDPTWGW